MADKIAAVTESDNIPENTYQEISDFGEKVLSYCLQKFGIIYKELADSPLFTEDIGNAVVMLQLHIRDFLRDQLFRGVEKMVGVIDFNQGYLAIRHILDQRSDQTLERYSVHTILLGYLALIAELIIFLDSVSIPAPKHWFAQIWTLIFEERLKGKFTGDWEGLKAEAKRWCNDCPDREELFQGLGLLEHPYAEIDPRIETSFRDIDPFFMFCSLGTGFEFPRKPGLAREVMDKLLLDPNLSSKVALAALS